MKAKTEVMEIRGKEKKLSKADKEYLIVRAEDEAGKVYELCDRNPARFDVYKKGKEMVFILDIQMGKYTNIEIVDIE